MVPTTQEISEHIYNHLLANQTKLKLQFSESKSKIGFFYIDNVLPEDLARSCYDVFPKSEDMRQLKSIREHKHVSAQMNKHHALLEHVIYAFQDAKILKLIGEICDIKQLFADDLLYAGGLSLMGKDQFLNPHLDNSHDAKRDRWRVLNLLYYVSPDWHLENGGHLELWPAGPSKQAILVESKFNRLVVMATHNGSWHSVSPVTVSQPRCCISNYYFSSTPLRATDTFHVTTFKGRSNDFFTNFILNVDSALRMGVRKVFKNGVRENPHIYKKEEGKDA